MSLEYSDHIDEFIVFAFEALKEGRDDELEEALRLRLKESSEDIVALLLKACISASREEIDTARVCMDKADDLIGAIALILERVGDSCRDSGFREEALRAYRRSLSLNPESREGVGVSKKILSLVDSDENADPQMDKITSAFYTVTMAGIYEKQGHMDRAEQVYRDILEREPENEEARRGYAEFLKNRDGEDLKIVNVLEGWLLRIKDLGNEE